MLRIVYFGSSDFSLPGLRACLDTSHYKVVGVITTPPQKQGRGLELTPTVIAQFCAEKSIHCFNFHKLDENAYNQVAGLMPDVFVVASRGFVVSYR